MPITSYHAKYFAYELTRQYSSDSLQKLAVSLSDAQVDLNPHQVEAALFAFRSPLSKGAILADEVGLGKTIEAGIVLSQKWAERKRRILIIVPSSLRKQWNQELVDKFFLPSYILETKSFNEEVRKGNLNPFYQNEVVICSYHFARAKDAYIKLINWDLVVIDEAHHLRNVYKNTNKIASAIKTAIAHSPKLLLTATPLQNSLMELYGLVSIIDDYTFGDLKSFKSQFARLTNEDNFDDLKARLNPVCKRTLRRQVLEYVKYTNRIPVTQEFYPTESEQMLYDMVSEYLQRPTLYALPASQRQLMTLILRKLLASSTYAISGTLEALAHKLDALIEDNEPLAIEADLSDDFEEYEELKDEWTGPYRIGKNIEDANIYRFGHPLAQRIIEKCKSPALDCQELVFDFSGTQKKISILEPLIGKTGWLSVCDLTIESFEVENDILFSGITDDGMALDVEQCQRLFSLPATIKPNQGEISGDVMRTLEVLAGKQQEDILQRNAGRNAGFFDSEMEKLDKWAEDVKNSLEIELKELDKEIKTRKTEAKKILKLEEKVAVQREIKEMEKKRNTLRQNLYQAQDEVDGKKENLISEIEARLKQKISREVLFTIRWRLL